MHIHPHAKFIVDRNHLPPIMIFSFLLKECFPILGAHFKGIDIFYYSRSLFYLAAIATPLQNE